MSKSKDVKITRSEFIELIYGQVGETFSDMLKYHEQDDDRAPFVNLEEQNAACKLMGIDITARTRNNTGNDQEYNISVIRKELTENIIGLFYDVLVEELEEVPQGRSSNIETMPDRLKSFYNFEHILTCPIESEAMLSKMLYLLGKYNNAYEYANNTKTLKSHIRKIDIYPLYKDHQGNYVSQAQSETLHLPSDQNEMIEALCKGIPEGCRNGSTMIPYDQRPDGVPRYFFAYPDIAMIISRMYEFRNESVHIANWRRESIAKKYQAVDDMVLTGMIVTAKKVWPLTLELYRRNDKGLIGAEEYCQSIVDSYRDSRENMLCCDFNWKLYDGNPDYVRNLKIPKRDSLKKISLLLWNEGQGKANLLQGVAGCGKSWALRRMQYFYACNYLGFDVKNNPGEEGNKIFCPLIPVYIPVINWYREMEDAESVIGVISRIIINNTAFEERIRERIPQGVRSLLEKGRFLIIFDGVDECPYEQKGHIYRTIDSFVSSFSGGKSSNLCMISDREISVENQAGMISYIADTIKDGDVNEYVKRFLRYTRPDLVDEEGHLSAIETDRFLERLKAMKPSSEIKTAFELAKLTEICANDEAYGKYLSEPEEKRKYFLDVIYLRVLLDRESKEKLSAESGSSETHMDLLKRILVHLSGKFEDECINKIDKDSFDKDIMSVTGADETLAQAYRKHLVQAGILSESQNMIDLKWYYGFVSEDIMDAAGLL